MRKFILGISAVLLVLIGILIGYYVHYLWNYAHKPLEKNQLITVKSGTGLSQLAWSLKREHIIENPALFIWIAKHKNDSDKLQTGIYEITSNDTVLTLLKKITKGDVVYRNFSIIEGSTISQVFTKLKNTELLTNTLVSVEQENDFRKSLGSNADSLEGLLSPDTYRFKAGNNDTLVLKRAYTKMQKVLQDVWDKRDPQLPYQTPYELLIAASIIEKESALPNERLFISGIIINRLNKRMRLQMDPTVMYGLTGNYDHELTKEDLAVDTPYNSYMYEGLPPTPIAMPSLNALNAAAHPVSTNYLYFVAKGDGTHCFSETLEEQTSAADQYRLYKQFLKNDNICWKALKDFNWLEGIQ